MNLAGTGHVKDKFLFIQFLKNYVKFSHHHLWYPSWNSEHYLNST